MMHLSKRKFLLLSSLVISLTFITRIPALSAELILSYDKVEFNSVTLTITPDEPAETYAIYRSLKPDAEFVEITRTEVLTYKDSGLSPGIKYYYMARGVDSEGGLSAPSIVIEVTPTLPKPVVTSVDASVSTFKLSWSAVSGASGYEIFRSEVVDEKAGSFSHMATLTDAAVKEYADSTVDSAKTYAYRVRAFRSLAEKQIHYGLYSNVRTIAYKPKKVSIKFISTRSSEVEIGVTKKGTEVIEGIEIYRSEALDAEPVPVGRITYETTFKDRGLKSAATYYYSARAFRGKKEGEIVYSDYSAVLKTTLSTPISKSAFVNASNYFTTDMFKAVVSNDKNVLISPVSILASLGLVTNGSDKETYDEINDNILMVMQLSDFNSGAKSYLSSLSSEKFKSTGAILIHKATLDSDFQANNANIYKNEVIMKDDFGDEAKEALNKFIESKTSIPGAVSDLATSARMYALSAATFSDKWKKPYAQNAVTDEIFRPYSGDTQKGEFMLSMEEEFIEDKNGVGFIKSFEDERYSFIALLPKNSMKISDYAAVLTGDNLRNLIDRKRKEKILVEIPKFSVNSTVNLKQGLKQMGLTEIFDPTNADLARLATLSDGANLYLTEPSHKATLRIDEMGSIEGKSTTVEMGSTPASRYIRFDKPFIFLIMDNQESVPLFIGSFAKFE